jgi:hypothetical protein
MTTWVLVYLFYGVDSITSGHIADFKSQSECLEASREVINMAAIYRDRASVVCIKRSTEKKKP